MALIDMSAEQAIGYAAKGVQEAFAKQLRAALAAHAEAIVKDVADRLALGIVSHLDGMVDHADFSKVKIMLRVDGVEKAIEGLPK